MDRRDTPPLGELTEVSTAVVQMLICVLPSNSPTCGLAVLDATTSVCCKSDLPDNLWQKRGMQLVLAVHVDLTQRNSVRIWAIVLQIMA
eukprot:5409403-Ditylum_brightwellii.AAC.1